MRDYSADTGYDTDIKISLGETDTFVEAAEERRENAGTNGAGAQTAQINGSGQAQVEVFEMYLN